MKWAPYNRIENLQVMSPAEHSKLHKDKQYEKMASI